MFKDWRAGLMHAGIFWGFVLLDDRDRQHRHGRDHRAGPVDPVRRAALDADQRDAERRRGDRPGLDRVGVLPAAGHEAATADLQPRRADHPGDDRRGRRDRAPGRGVRVRGPRRPAGRVRVRGAGRAAPSGALAPRPSRRGSRCSGGRTSRSSRRSCVPAVQQAPPHRHAASRTSGSASSRRGASCRRWTSRTRTRRSGSRRSRTSAGRTCSTASRAPNAVAARRPARPGTPGSRSTPRPSSWASATCRSRPSTASTSSRTRRSCARRTASTTRTRRRGRGQADRRHAIPYDAVWDCVTCGACVEACPVLIEHVDKIVGLRRNLVLEESRFPQELTPAFRAMEGQGNPWGQPASARLDWTKPLPFEVPTVAALAAAGELDELEVLYWVGCAAAFDPRNQKVARAVATCLHAAGVSFAVLGQEESCTGDPARRMGNDYVFQMLASRRVDDPQPLRDGGANDRHGLSALLQHHRQRVRPAGRLIPRRAPLPVPRRPRGVRAAGDAARGRRVVDGRPPAGRVTVHDSCYLARYNGVVAAPRSVLGAAGVSITEMREERQGHVLLRRGRRPDVDGGDARHADQRGADAPGARDRRVDGRDGLSVLHGHDDRRPRRGRWWQRRSPRWTSARSSPARSRACPRTVACLSSEG